MARKGINSTHSVYYGRGRKKGRRLLILLLVLLITAGVLAGGYFYLQEHIVYTADGFYFDFPFLSGKEPTTPEDVPLVVDDGSEKEEEGNKDPEDKDEEETPPESAPTVTAMEGDLSRIGDANYRSQLMNQAWKRRLRRSGVHCEGGRRPGGNSHRFGHRPAGRFGPAL